MDVAPPKDKWNIIYIILMINGLGSLTAWNMFITAKAYFVEYKLAGTKEYSENYLSYVGWAAQVPNCAFNWLNIFVPIKGSLTKRIVWSLMFEVAIFVLTVGLAMVDSSAWPGVFFWITMISVLLMNSFNAIFHNCVYGVAARLPPKYTGAVVLGSNVCGTIVVFMSWASELFDSRRTSAIYYFIFGILVLLVCFDTYFALPLNKFYRYHDTLQQAATNQTTSSDRTKIPYSTIFRQAWVQLYNVFIVFFVSLSIFPAVHSDIEPIQNGFLGTKFVLISCFLTFNLTSTIGNITASLRQFPPRKYLWIMTTLRFVLIPFFLMCNYKPARRTLPVLIRSDVLYWAVAAFLGWSHGHASSLGMMYVGGTVASEHASIAGMLGAAMLVTGIMCGLLFTRLCPAIVT